MTFRLVPEGATITRTYLAVPGTYTSGEEFPNTTEGWDAAVRCAREKHAGIVASVVAGGLGEEYARACADAQAVVDLRWTIKYPDGSVPMSGLDTVVERLKVGPLRTSGEFGAKEVVGD